MIKRQYAARGASPPTDEQERGEKRMASSVTSANKQPRPQGLSSSLSGSGREAFLFLPIQWWERRKTLGR